MERARKQNDEAGRRSRNSSGPGRRWGLPPREKKQEEEEKGGPGGGGPLSTTHGEVSFRVQVQGAGGGKIDYRGSFSY